jgi:hypothetical protein
LEIDFRIKPGIFPTITAMDLQRVSLNEGQLELTYTPVPGPDVTDGSIAIGTLRFDVPDPVQTSQPTTGTTSAGSFSTNVDTWDPIAIADFNGDRHPDILWLDTSGRLVISLMRGRSVLKFTLLGEAPAGWAFVRTEDFNGDGKADILWQNPSGDLAVSLTGDASWLQELLDDLRARSPLEH